MLGKRYRLPAKEFPSRSSRAYKSPCFSVYHCPNSYPYNRLAVHVGKKVFVHATKRNALKRFLVGLGQALPPKGIDFLIIVNPRAAKAGKIELNKEVQAMYKYIIAPHTRA